MTNTNGIAPLFLLWKRWSAATTNRFAPTCCTQRKVMHILRNQQSTGMRFPCYPLIEGMFRGRVKIVKCNLPWPLSVSLSPLTRPTLYFSKTPWNVRKAGKVEKRQIIRGAPTLKSTAHINSWCCILSLAYTCVLWRGRSGQANSRRETQNA